ncbi:hypothetical protein FQA39_LY09525 [Lamprigera yunnana]|nr:hypothetical protein FQA39_LY09525 [Lamprigera yunnana]
MTTAIFQLQFWLNTVIIVLQYTCSFTLTTAATVTFNFLTMYKIILLGLTLTSCFLATIAKPSPNQEYVYHQPQDSQNNSSSVRQQWGTPSLTAEVYSYQFNSSYPPSSYVTSSFNGPSVSSSQFPPSSFASTSFPQSPFSLSSLGVASFAPYANFFSSSVSPLDFIQSQSFYPISSASGHLPGYQNYPAYPNYPDIPEINSYSNVNQFGGPMRPSSQPALPTIFPGIIPESM